MTGVSEGPPPAEVLVDRMAAALVTHEPGWRLPRHTALARRYNVSTSEIEAALDELAARHIIRRLPDGQLYRSSPVEYLIPIEGVPGLASRADPMGGQIVCRGRQASMRQVSEDVAWVLGVGPAEPVGVVRVQWSAGSEPAAFTTTYLPADLAAPLIGAGPGSPGGVSLALNSAAAAAGVPGQPGELAGEPGAVHVVVELPPPKVARSLHLAAGQPAVLVTVRFDDPQQGRPVALTVAAFRPDLFRIVVQTAGPASAATRPGAHFPSTWANADREFEH